MDIKAYLDSLSLIISLSSMVISLFSYSKSEKARKDSIAISKISLDRDLAGPFQQWLEQLGVIEPDPPPGEYCRVYTETERRRIRNYWPRVVHLELERLNAMKKADEKLEKPFRKEWERKLKEGLGHRSILQEFCYYAKYESPNNVTKDEVVEIVKRLYREMGGDGRGKELNIDDLLEERKLYTRKDVQ